MVGAGGTVVVVVVVVGVVEVVVVDAVVVEVVDAVVGEDNPAVDGPLVVEVGAIVGGSVGSVVEEGGRRSADGLGLEKPPLIA